MQADEAELADALNEMSVLNAQVSSIGARLSSIVGDDDDDLQALSASLSSLQAISARLSDSEEEEATGSESPADADMLNACLDKLGSIDRRLQSISAPQLSLSESLNSLRAIEGRLDYVYESAVSIVPATHEQSEEQAALSACMARLYAIDSRLEKMGVEPGPCAVGEEGELVESLGRLRAIGSRLGDLESTIEFDGHPATAADTLGPLSPISEIPPEDEPQHPKPSTVHHPLPPPPTPSGSHVALPHPLLAAQALAPGRRHARGRSARLTACPAGRGARLPR